MSRSREQEKTRTRDRELFGVCVCAKLRMGVLCLKPAAEKLACGWGALSHEKTTRMPCRLLDSCSCDEDGKSHAVMP